jgi:subtilisin family serine protease
LHYDILPSFTFPGTVGGTKYGIAKKANLISVKVFDRSGGGTISSVIAGIDWLVGRPRPYGAVANLSLGVEARVRSLNKAVNNAVAAGVVMVVAAGNSDVDACFTSPASATNAITVGATGEDDSRASFSNFGTCVDIFAPGVDIVSAQTNTVSGSMKLSGTSMATPHVAGVAALLLEANPGISPSEVTVKILSSATAGVLTDLAGSPNLMLYTGDITGSDGSLPEASPQGTEDDSAGYRYFDDGSFRYLLLLLLLL